MLRTLQIYFLIIQYFTLVKCEIPTLSVRKVDSKIIEKKRQDTLEICRLFNEENNHLQTIEQNEYQPKYYNQSNRRFKRYIESAPHNSPLHKEDIDKFETIVDKLYDDLQEDGSKVTYRRRNLENSTNNTNVTAAHRRYNFAPAKLLPPGPQQPNIIDDKDDEPVQSPLAQTIPVVPGSGSWIKKWKHGIIPYFIDPKTYDNYLSEMIISAFDYIEKATCIRLQRLREKPRDKKSMQDAEWLYITNPSGIQQCVHSNERKPNLGVQMVVFGYDCMTQGAMAHEIMHVLGFSHEHTRPDRDKYITINWKNIKPGYKKYFNLQTDNQLTHLPYDYASVLHYPPRAFSKNGQLTISVQSGTTIGQRAGLSEIDVEKIGTIFGPECTKRNKDYLLKTCPSVVNGETDAKPANPEEIEKYFRDRIWPYGIVSYKLKDSVEFSTEERLNIKAVLAHIEKETCIEFRDVSESGSDEQKYNSKEKENMNEANKKQGGTAENIDDATDDTNNHKVSDNEIASNENTAKLVSNDTETVKNEESENETTAKPEVIETVNETTAEAVVNRRHAANIYVLTRSSKPGCQCPPPGRPNGNKAIQISSDCFNSVNDLLHFFVHLLGLDHEHNMYDRDSFIQILWDQLTPELKSDMKKKLPPAAAAGFTYDYQSIMHFPWLEIKDGVTNIMYPIWNDGWAMGHWQGLSVTDVKKLNRIYEQECAAKKNRTD